MSILIKLVEHVTEIKLISKHTKYSNFDIFNKGGLINFTIEILKIFFILTFTIHIFNNILNMFQNNKC